MATESAYIAAREGGVGARRSYSQLLTLTVAGNTTVAGTISVPAGSWLDKVQIETATAITGTPTSCLVRVGKTLHGQEIVADVDAKAQGHIAATIVAGYDSIGAGDTTYFVEVTTSGGTSSAGPISIIAKYHAPIV